MKDVILSFHTVSSSLSLPIVCKFEEWERFAQLLGHVHTRASDPGPKLMWVGPRSEALFTLARQNLSGFNLHR